jgi:threonyl-tRNA synthetase
MVIWNVLEDLRRRENLQRGYVEVKTPLIYDVETWTRRATARSTRERCSSLDGDERRSGSSR